MDLEDGLSSEKRFFLFFDKIKINEFWILDFGVWKLEFGV